MRRLFRFLSTSLFLFASAILFGADEKIDPMKLSMSEFFRIVRHAPAQESWAKMSGTAQHKRDGSRRIKSPIRLGIRFTPSRIVAQMIFHEKEVYELGQSFDPPVSTTETRIPPGADPQLGLYGIDATDLTLGFLYKDVIREEGPEHAGIFPCRVFLMKTAVAGETARVFISTEYFFPIKVLWFREDPVKNAKAVPYRELEIASVKKAPDSDFYVIPKLELNGPGWKTKIEFDDCSAGYAKDGMPKDLFQEK